MRGAQEPSSVRDDRREPTTAVRALLRAAAQAQVALSRQLGLRTTDAEALDHLVSDGPDGLGPGELGKRLGMRSASATALVDRLELAGHVRREPHPADRRRQVVRPTEHAVDEVFRRLLPLIEGIDAVAAELTPDESRTVTAFLTRVAEVMRDYAADAESPR